MPKSHQDTAYCQAEATRAGLGDVVGKKRGRGAEYESCEDANPTGAAASSNHARRSYRQLNGRRPRSSTTCCCGVLRIYLIPIGLNYFSACGEAQDLASPLRLLFSEGGECSTSHLTGAASLSLFNVILGRPFWKLVGSSTLHFTIMETGNQSKYPEAKGALVHSIADGDDRGGYTGLLNLLWHFAYAHKGRWGP